MRSIESDPMIQLTCKKSSLAPFIQLVKKIEQSECAVGINDLITQDGLDFARRHLTTYYDTDFFPKPFEFKALWHGWENVSKLLSNPGWQPFGNPITIPWKKPRGGYRVVHQLDPIDSICYAAATYSISKDVEKNRQPRKERIACSYRIDPDHASFFVDGSGFVDYRERCQELSEKYKYVLTTDISDFYNRIYLHRLGNAISLSAGEMAGKEIEGFLTTINSKVSQGVPVGPASSIVLSEATLIDVDQFLKNQRFPHVRYVDDIRMFSNSEHDLDVLLQKLSSYLHSNHRLSLVGDKTKILSSDEFIHQELSNQYQIEKLEILKEIEVFNPYQADFDIEDESENDEGVDIEAALLDALQRISKYESLDLAVARAILRRGKAARTDCLCEFLIKKIGYFRPVVNDVVLYIDAVTSDLNIKKIEKLLVDATNERIFDDRATSEWLSWYISKNGYLSNNHDLRVFFDYTESLRYHAVAAISTKNHSWVREYKDKILQYGPWDRRSIIYASCLLPKDEREKWLNAILKTGALLQLDKIIIDWVNAGMPNSAPLPIPTPEVSVDDLLDEDLFKLFGF